MAETTPAADHGDDESRRDYLYLATGAMTVAGAAAVAWPLADNLRPAADV